MKNLLARILYISSCVLVMSVVIFGSVEKLRLSAEVSAGLQAEPKTVYLTFDDGPSSRTGKVLEALERNGVKATFFVTAQYEDYIPLLSEEARLGHLVAPHSASHNFSRIYSSTEAFWQDQQKMMNTILTYTATTPRLLRFAGGSSNTVYRAYSPRGLMRTLAEQCAERGITYHDWNVDSRDWQSNRSAASITANVINGVKACEDTHIVVLFHDSPSAPNTAAALDGIISTLRQMGFRFDTLDNLEKPCHHSFG